MAALFAAAIITIPAAAQDEAAPANLDQVHLGVATCAGGPCHGAAQNHKVTGVLQNEYLTWQRYDKHAKAYTALEGPVGRRIAANLGIGPATKAKMCLDCHADNVPAELRGVQFHIEDGVGCEACHGASKRWLGPHITGKIPHAQLVSDYGLAALDQPLVRAQTCINCHWGDESKFVTHRIMGAGHPRLAFELETFTQIEPAHFVIDDVYKRRKAVAQGVQFWAVGQATALERMMQTMQGRRGQGVFPELVFFDCDSCHHPTTNLRWAYRASSKLGPGLPHFNDANALMLEAVATRLSPELGRALDSQVLALHAALSEGRGNPQAIAAQLAQTAHSLQQQFANHEFSRGDMSAMIEALVTRAQQGDAVDYAGAEQMTMAFAAIVYTLNAEADVDGSQYAALKSALDQCYAATAKEDAYEPAPFVTAAVAVGRALPSS